MKSKSKMENHEIEWKIKDSQRGENIFKFQIQNKSKSNFYFPTGEGGFRRAGGLVIKISIDNAPVVNILPWMESHCYPAQDAKSDKWKY